MQTGSVDVNSGDGMADDTSRASSGSTAICVVRRPAAPGSRGNWNTHSPFTT